MSTSEPAAAVGHRRARRGGAWWALAAGALGVGALVSGCGEESDPNAYAPPPPPEVIVARPQEREVTAYLTYTGVIEASETVELRARVQGFLEKVNFKPGQRVKKGDLLFVIDKRPYEAAVAQARANVQAQKASHQGAENDARLARELADQRAGPEIDAVIKGARRDVAAAEIARAEAQLQNAELDLAYCEIIAPMDGRISKNEVDVGNLVGRGEPTLLATIVQAVPAYVSVDVSEADVLGVRRERGMSEQVEEVAPRACELALADESEFAVKGGVDYVDPQVNVQTGTLLVRTRYENEDESLMPGLFARVRFPMSNRRSLVVPESALLRDQQGRYAMVVNDSNEVEVRRVTIGALDGSDRVIEEGLGAADRVIVLGVLKARPGAKVTPKTQEAAPAGR